MASQHIRPDKDWRCSESCPSYDPESDWCTVLDHQPNTFCEPKLILVRSDRKRKRKRISKLEALVSDLAYDDECDLDHHGSCQAHDWFGDAECPHARAQKLLNS